MTVRFKSEYQKSFGDSRSRSVSPQRCAPSAGLRSDQLGMSREPSLQRRKRLGPGGALSNGSLLCPPDSEPPLIARKTAPPAAHRNEPKASTPPGTRPDPETPTGPRPAADPGPGASEKSAKTSKPVSRPQLHPPMTTAPDGQQPSANEVQPAVRQRAGGHRSESHRQLSWKKPAAAASPILTAEQVLHTSNRPVPSFKKSVVAMETEYQRNFQGLAPPTKPRLRKHLELQRVPLFHTYMINKKRRAVSENRLFPKNDLPAPQEEDTMSSAPPLVQRGYRMLTEYQSSFRSPLYRIPEEGGATDSDIPQVMTLRQQALVYRRRAWGINFCRDHLNQLLSEHNTLWEPTETTDSATDPPTPRSTSEPCHNLDHNTDTPLVEALDLCSRSSNSSRRSSVLKSGETNQTTQRNAAAKTHVTQEEEENTDEEEGKLPTSRLKMLPVQRTHHDLTTPATGGAIQVGKLKINNESSPSTQQRCGSAVSMAAEAVGNVPVRHKEAWPETNPIRDSSCVPSSNHKPATSSPSKPIGMIPDMASPIALPILAPPPHCIQGSLRHADFQHNGELGLRFRELHCAGGGCHSDEDDRLSVVSWRSAASCSMASAVLERAQKRREDFWGKR